MKLNQLLDKIVSNDQLHCQWLNTLSFMENAGARKISKAEHPINVSLLQLKHACEEHRHAYYLKKQIGKINPNLCKTYQSDELLAPLATRQYLHRLDIEACKYLKKRFQLSHEELQFAAYLFVTYAIEVRADLLYPIYQEILSKYQSKVMVKSIILEEEGHLEEMISQLNQFDGNWKDYADEILKIEEQLYESWMTALVDETVIFENVVPL